MSVSDRCLAIDTGVLTALAAATGGWEVLDSIDRNIFLTPSVLAEVRRGEDKIGARCALATCMQVWPTDPNVPSWLSGVLDRGEATVIALSLEQKWPEVAIDEVAARSVARLCDLKLTGSLGLLIRAKRAGYSVTIQSAVQRLRDSGIWIGDDLALAAMIAAGEVTPGNSHTDRNG